jgi:hypothetical protein
VLRRQDAAKHKLARRQAAKLCYRFGPLTPFCALREPDRSDGTKNGFPAPNKEPTTNQKLCLTGEAPYRFESISLQRRVHQTSPDRLTGGANRQNLPSSPKGRIVCTKDLEMVVEVSYVEWTPDRLLRHVVYLGEREDKLAIEMRRSRPNTGEP